MSRQSAKAARRSSKTARRTVKKSAKSTRKGVRAAKKPSKSARNRVGKATRAAPAPRPAPKSVLKSASKPAVAAVAVQPKMIRTLSPPVQPLAPPDIPVRKHRYQVGEMVYYTSPSFGRTAASGNYTVVKLLPSEGDDYQYRIKSSGEAFERVAKESQLEKL